MANSAYMIKSCIERLSMSYNKQSKFGLMSMVKKENGFEYNSAVLSELNPMERRRAHYLESDFASLEAVAKNLDYSLGLVNSLSKVVSDVESAVVEVKEAVATFRGTSNKSLEEIKLLAKKKKSDVIEALSQQYHGRYLLGGGASIKPFEANTGKYIGWSDSFLGISIPTSLYDSREHEFSIRGDSPEIQGILSGLDALTKVESDYDVQRAMAVIEESKLSTYRFEIETQTKYLESCKETNIRERAACKNAHQEIVINETKMIENLYSATEELKLLHEFCAQVFKSLQYSSIYPK